MRIAIDVSQIIYGTGVSHYRENLVRNLLHIDKQSLASGAGKSNDYILYGGSLRRYAELKSKIEDLGKPGKVFPFPPRLADIIWNKLHVLPIERFIGQIDVLHTSDWAEPPSAAFKVTTIHDVIPLKFPKVTPQIIVSTHRQRLKWVAKESRRIIVPSITTKNDLVELGFSEDILRVVYEAPNFSRATDGQIGVIKRKYRIFGNYLLAIGAAQRKNVDRIIQAYHLSRFGKDLKLVVVGEKRDGVSTAERGVVFLGHVPNEDLASLLSGASALVFPSLYEGFGIPILDAFNCQVPVVTSNISSMPEAAGDAAILVDPYDSTSIAAGIEKAISMPKSLISKGLKHVQAFSWEKTAEETLKVYNESRIK